MTSAAQIASSPAAKSRDSVPRILFLTHVGEPGGAEYVMLNLCRALPSQSEVMLFQHGSLEGLLQRSDVRFTVSPLAGATHEVRKDSGLLSLLRAIPGVAKQMRNVVRRARAADVVVCFSQKSFVVAALARPFLRRPVIWFMNDILAPSHFSKMLIAILVVLSRMGADHVVLNSRASLEAWRESRGRRRAVSVIYPGIDEKAVLAQAGDTERVERYKRAYSPDGKPLIGIFGRIDRWKGQDVFIRAIAELPDVRAIIVGGALFGASDFETECGDLVRKLGLEDRVAFLGHSSEAFALMAACDVVAHCSTSPEPFGQVIAEAMFAGTPVIATNAGGAKEIVTQQTGQLTPPGDHRALAAAIRRCVDDPIWARQTALRARAHVRTQFAVATMTTEFLKVVQTLA